MIEFDLTGQRLRLETIRALRDDGVGVEDGADALGAHRSLRNGIRRSGEILNGLEELRQVSEVDRQLSYSHRACEDERRPAPEHDGRAKCNGNVDDRRKKRLDAACLESRAYRRLADIVQKLFFHSLLTESFDHLDRFEILLGYRENRALFFADLVGRLLNSFFEPRHKEQKKWRYRYGDKREVPVEPEHKAQHAKNGEKIDKNIERG